MKLRENSVKFSKLNLGCWSRVMKANTGIVAVLGLLLVLFIIGMTMTADFGTVQNLANVFQQATGLAIVSLGQTVAVLTGGIDLSVGSLISLTSTLFSGFVNGDPGKVVYTAIGVLVLSAVVGLINGALTVTLKVHPLIVTLGMSAVLQGAVLLYTLSSVGSMPEGFDALAYGTFHRISISAMVVILAYLLVAMYLRYRTPGRYIYMVGDDPVAAKLVGLPRHKVIMLVYAFSGLCAGIAGIYLTAQFGSAQPYVGANYTLASITPVVVGGTILSGGRGGVIGTLLGVYLISLLNNVINQLGVSTQYQMIIQGLVIIIAVSVYVEQRRRVA
jgi:ribose transport system permease protein